MTRDPFHFEPDGVIARFLWTESRYGGFAVQELYPGAA